MSSVTDELLDTNCICCIICGDLLTPPIMLVENIGNVCATCYEQKQEIIDKNLSLHNSAAEIILKTLRLPCKYKTDGCDLRLFYDELISHQNSCRYQKKRCSLFKFSECDWEGNSEDFLDHFKEAHGDHIINFENNLFFLQTSLRDVDLVKLLLMKNRAYILRMHINLQKDKLYYFICNVKDDDLLYEYSVKHKGNSDNHIKTKSKILPAVHLYNDFDETIAVEVDLNALKLIAQISETSNHVTNIFKIKVDVQIEGVNDKMLQFFECPVCKSFMKPPIFQCQSGHSICNMCRPRLEKCPTCRSMFGTTRNYSLEGLTAGVYYPCVYHDLGCSEISLASQITKHENECTFKPYNCPFPNCILTGNHRAIMTHIKEFHPEGVIFSGTPGYTDSFHLDLNLCYNKIIERKCVITYGHIFRLAYKRISEYCLWAAEIIGFHDPAKTFVYEVTIIDTVRPEKKLIRTDYCLNEMSEDELFKRCIMFPNSILSSYSNRGMVTFQFAIKEK